MVLVVLPAFALTLDEAVHRAAEVDPDALVADCQAQLRGLRAGEAWSALTVTPKLKYRHTWEAGEETDTWSFRADLDTLDASLWFDAFTQSARHERDLARADGARIDAEYYAAELYAQVVAAQARVAAAQHASDRATATQKATAARVAAGLESELLGKSAALEVMAAEADRAKADAELTVAELALARVLQADGPVGVEAFPPPPLGEWTTASTPEVRAAKAELAALRAADGAAWGSLLPTGVVRVESDLPDVSWKVTAGFTWTLRGLAAPVFAERQTALGVKIGAIELDAAVRDAEQALGAAMAQARAAKTVAEVAHAREDLAEQALAVGQARLVAGMSGALEVLRLQDDAAKARDARVSADLDAVTTVLEARRIAGVPWGD